MSYDNLKGRRILIAEDEYLLAEDISAGLQMTGAHVVGPFGSVDAALRACVHDPEPDAAVLDINLAGHRVFPLADELVLRRVPFLFTTGYDDIAVPEAFLHVKRLQKPIGIRALLDALSGLLPPRRDLRSQSGPL